MLELGKFHTLPVTRLSPHGAYLFWGEGEVLLPNKFVPANIRPDDRISVFLYTDSEDRLVATTQTPLAQANQFAPLRAIAVSDVGAFMDWGLDKDLLVPFREQRRPIRAGETHVVRVCHDYRSNRLIGSTKLLAFFERDTDDLEINQPVQLLVYDRTDLGYMVVIDGAYQGLLYHTDAPGPLKSGEVREGFINQIRPDGKIDVKLASFDNIQVYKQQLMGELKLNGGFLPFHDRSDPNTIQRVLRMSKKTFKKAVGVLLKEGKIRLREEGIELLP